MSIPKCNKKIFIIIFIIQMLTLPHLRLRMFCYFASEIDNAFIRWYNNIMSYERQSRINKKT